MSVSTNYWNSLGTIYHLRNVKVGLVTGDCIKGVLQKVIPHEAVVLSRGEDIYKIPYVEIDSIRPVESEGETSVESKNYESEDIMVSHPSHYQSDSGLEVIDVIEAFTAGLEGIEATDTGNIIKYICRWKQKNGIQDLEKCKWYLTHLINHLKEKENK